MPDYGLDQALEPVKVMISNADQHLELCQSLERHLSDLQRQGLIELGCDRKSDAEVPLKQLSDSPLHQADVILFLTATPTLSIFVRSSHFEQTSLPKTQDVAPDEGLVATQPKFAHITQGPSWTPVVQEVSRIAQDIQKQILAAQQAQTRQVGITEYKQVAEKFFHNGDISPVERKVLARLAEKHQLSAGDINQIRMELKAAYDAQNSNLQDYRDSVELELQHRQGKLEEAQAGLNELRLVLGISEDVAGQIQQEILKEWKPPEQDTPFDVVLLNPEGKEKQRTTHQTQYYVETLASEVDLELAAIPEGKFHMGSTDDDKYHDKNEKPQHVVEVPPFYMSKYPITQEQWRAVAQLEKISIDLKADPSHFKGSQLPVESVSWYEAVEFCDRLTRLTGKAYRLPSEAEWEYACRAKTETIFHFGNTISPEFANYDSTILMAFVNIFREEAGQVGRGTTPVGHFRVANAFGLYDMHGNVAEWCLDTYQKTYDLAPADGSAWIDMHNGRSQCVKRGGDWFSSSMNCYSASRGSNAPDEGNNQLGFRVVRTFI